MSFSTLEKKAVLGIGAIALFLGVSLFEIGKRNLWFESKNTYRTKIKDADGLRVGSVVTIAGLRVGNVADLAVDETNQIAVKLSVISSVAARIRQDSYATVFRAFVIGDKRIEIVPGSDAQPALADGATLESRETTELTEFISGKKLAELMAQIELLIGGVNRVVTGVDEVMGKYESGAFNQTFSRLDPALDNFLKLSDDLIVMTKEAKKKSKELPVVIEQGAGLLGDLREDLFKDHLARQSLAHVNSSLGALDKIVNPIAAREKLVENLLGNLEDLSRDLKNNPQYAQQVIDALKELTITLKALQKTWILEGKTQEVKDEQRSK
jgi:phospholipid/cholesterol/gamma-HCH transport system substrate-binding protein